jgi:hypothetical protein
MLPQAMGTSSIQSNSSEGGRPKLFLNTLQVYLKQQQHTGSSSSSSSSSSKDSEFTSLSVSRALRG